MFDCCAHGSIDSIDNFYQSITGLGETKMWSAMVLMNCDYCIYTVCNNCECIDTLSLDTPLPPFLVSPSRLVEGDRNFKSILRSAVYGSNFRCSCVVGPGNRSKRENSASHLVEIHPQSTLSTTSQTESTVDSPIPTTLILTSTPTHSITNIGTSPSTDNLNLPKVPTTPQVSLNPTSFSIPSETSVPISLSTPVSVFPQSSQSGTRAFDISSLSLPSATISFSILPTVSPTASSEAHPTAIIPGTPKNNTARNRILPIAIVLPILLIITSLIVWRRRRTRVTLLRPYTTSQNGVDDWEANDSCGNSQTITPFVVSEKVESADVAVMTICADTKRRVPTNATISTNVRTNLGLSVRSILKSVRKWPLALTGAHHRVF